MKPIKQAMLTFQNLRYVQINELFFVKNSYFFFVQGHAAIVNAMVEHNNVLYTGDGDGKLIAWDLTSFQQISSLNLEGYINDLAIAEKDGIIYVSTKNKNIVGVQLS